MKLIAALLMALSFSVSAMDMPKKGEIEIHTDGKTFIWTWNEYTSGEYKTIDGARKDIMGLVSQIKRDNLQKKKVWTKVETFDVNL